ncbi:MAG: hypothetical protein HFH87_12140 [Lachnospiraceae bacterium]|nr:hypothetical protein [Lachnospiraceae bacterium]
MKYILLSICGNKKAVVEEILSWTRKGEDVMVFKYNIIKAFEDERAEGEAIGEARGELRKVISLVRRKVARNMSPEEIADMLEEEYSLVSQIYAIMKRHPDWNDDKISDSIRNGSAPK